MCRISTDFRTLVVSLIVIESDTLAAEIMKVEMHRHIITMTIPIILNFIVFCDFLEL